MSGAQMGDLLALYRVDALAPAIASIGALLTVRLLAPVCFAILSSAVPLSIRLTSVVVYLILASALRRLEVVSFLIASYVYFAGITATIPHWARWIAAKRVTRGGSFVFFAAAFLIMPALLWPHWLTRGAVLILGWDMMLASYSYCIETSARPGSIRSCLFFVLVNPALCYSNRGATTNSPGIRTWGLRRCVAGLLALFFGAAIFPPLGVAYSHWTSICVAPLYIKHLGNAGIRLLENYSLQSGLAAFQIGCFCQLGLLLPERFQSPLLAASPVAFWQRWNTYVSLWLQRYVFWPAALVLARAGTTARIRLAQAVAVIATFGAAGLLHDSFAFASGAAPAGRATVAFVSAGIVLLAWVAAEYVTERDLLKEAMRPLRGSFRVAGGIVFWTVQLVLFSIWQP
jgi:hypothetical protein